MSHRLLNTCCVLSLLLVQHSYAKDDTLELLAQKGIISAEEYAKIRENQKDQGQINLKDGLKVVSHDGKNSLQVGGMLQLDVAGYQDDRTDISNSTELRRARLAVSGQFQQDWDYKTEIEFAGTVAVTDAYVAYTGFKPVTLTVGHFKNLYSLEALMADKNLTFMERSLSAAFLNPRAPALMVSAGSEQWSGAVALVGEQLSTASLDDEGGGVSGRFTFVPYLGNAQIVHVGASGHWRKPTQSNATDKTSETLRFHTKPESNQFNFNKAGTATSRLIDTGDISGNVDDYTLMGVELATQLGAWVVQSEYSQAKIKRDTKANLSFEGGYLQLAYILTGERRSYRGDKGIFEGIKPARSTGAWEVAARYSQLDLSDADVYGGKEKNLTLGINWYANSLIKLSTNYVKVLEVKGGSQAGNEPSVLQVRAQISY